MDHRQKEDGGGVYVRKPRLGFGGGIKDGRPHPNGQGVEQKQDMENDTRRAVDPTAGNGTKGSGFMGGGVVQYGHPFFGNLRGEPSIVIDYNSIP
jgi:hypothetical protein